MYTIYLFAKNFAEFNVKSKNNSPASMSTFSSIPFNSTSLVSLFILLHTIEERNK